MESCRICLYLPTFNCVMCVTKMAKLPNIKRWKITCRKRLRPPIKSQLSISLLINCCSNRKTITSVFNVHDKIFPYIISIFDRGLANMGSDTMYIRDFGHCFDLAFDWHCSPSHHHEVCHHRPLFACFGTYIQHKSTRT